MPEKPEPEIDFKQNFSYLSMEPKVAYSPVLDLGIVDFSFENYKKYVEDHLALLKTVFKENSYLKFFCVAFKSAIECVDSGNFIFTEENLIKRMNMSFKLDQDDGETLYSCVSVGWNCPCFQNLLRIHAQRIPANWSLKERVAFITGANIIIGFAFRKLHRTTGSIFEDADYRAETGDMENPLIMYDIKFGQETEIFQEMMSFALTPETADEQAKGIQGNVSIASTWRLSGN